jgi:hypothetical protein
MLGSLGRLGIVSKLAWQKFMDVFGTAPNGFNYEDLTAFNNDIVIKNTQDENYLTNLQKEVNENYFERKTFEDLCNSV